VIVEIEYKNGFSISVDADLILGRSAYVHIKIASIKGKARIQFTRYLILFKSFFFLITERLRY
jgi:PDZ domain-containing protein 8